MADTAAEIAAALRTRLSMAANALMLHGALPWEVDEALTATGFTIGPLEAEDLIGLHLVYRHGPPGLNRVIPDRMIAEGRLGKIAGVGWYRYPGGGGAVIDPLIEDLIAEESHFARITRREFTGTELCRLLIAALASAAQGLQSAGAVKSRITDAAVHLAGFAGMGELLWAGQADINVGARIDDTVWVTGRSQM